MRVCFVMVVVALLAAVPAGAQMYLELGTAPIRDPIPPMGSNWHELYPNFCVVHTQAGYDDNGDNEVSVCDVIILDSGARYHVDWVGPTYYVANLQSGEPRFLEPTTEPGGPPIGTYWHEVAPNFCVEHLIDDWEDGDASGTVTECDNVLFDGEWWHVEEVRLDITVSPEPSPVDESTWSKVKSFFSGMRFF